ncbi:WhiB family transcriptional regulator [Streptomyces ortus]|uniref:WhiB family transcriptional regulator n=1 Tax=Streptomyces ortus TaxID=2867268 RepID=A0ABT3UW04_9ACTN|nr:WhiB family transcriptional regulator [Streptomyces ortus]MCX4231743.1 WhiB family transcriptional regulator [Streptomyces ortus]
MSRPGIPKPTDYVDLDPRFPFPHTPTRTVCQEKPSLFDFAAGDRVADRAATEKRLAQADAACAGCPIAAACLRWALVNKQATRTGVFAATTPRQRTVLRERLADRLGPDWIDVLAAQDQNRRERAAAARHDPLTVSQSRIVRLDRDVNGPLRPRRGLPAVRQQSNRALLDAAAQQHYGRGLPRLNQPKSA